MSADGMNESPLERDTAGSGLESLLAQLRRKSNQDALSSPTSSGTVNIQQHDLLTHLSSYQPHPTSEPYYPQQPSDGPMAAPPHFPPNLNSLPSAPTPPVGGSFPNAQFPPSLLGSIGSGRPSRDRATSSQLLNLLKFSGQPTGSGPSMVPVPSAPAPPQDMASHEPEPPVQHAAVSLPPSMIHAPAPAPSDPTGLLAALMKGTLKDEQPKPEPPAPTTSWTSTSQSNETQQYLLNLLNRPKPSQTNNDGFSAESPKPASVASSSNREPRNGKPTGLEQFDESGAQERGAAAPQAMPTSDFDFNVPKPKTDESGTPKTKTSIFSLHSPFDGLRIPPSPPDLTNLAPKSSTSPGIAEVAPPPPVQILKKPASQSPPKAKGSSSESSPFEGPEHEEAMSDAVPENNGQGSASDAELDESADSDAQETAVGDDSKEDSDANEHANEHANAQVNMDEIPDDKFNHAKPDQEELQKEGNGNVLEDAAIPDITQAARDIVDEAAQGPVADNWESADADGDEIVVMEDQPSPVQVFNFPMKPWISIDVQDDDKESRPLFREDSILDIARLKKEFDQIDRNLVAASENYMAYGMSKAGGLRVIRQTDGRDAKLFTDTKDRIFNVAMSSNNGDQGVVPRDSIIGTGISGTVYWVQVRDGEKDHLEYAHPELYGFALPPILSHEGDTPGGVLKTRARTSSGHPEYFAVGRGKSINIVWPGFIMRNNLLKAGHDRVVDTENLAKQCSLKINTGKAGKDFTFSQDDTVVVSLDKSGRVKFWDVRDLTAARDDSDPRNPMPVHTSLEVKEPLMVLTTTPEGEKAWPTSVLLLDKLRPYQKRCALRYMIVGMKQNHTLQLWDLALGKPVQEFNLPHSKESDAVCSVMYHPPTGMIVVGHPTRNSVYFLHLSAPKYAVKNLSQVEYIQRLTAEDSSIPQPESTAVISGLREYSFACRGALRSLDILQSPASNADGDDPTLFELYAMHSKGVSCIFIRQGELGWTKDNKVINPVDAVETGKVKIGKLRSPQQPTPPPESRGGEPGQPAAQHAPRIIASRSAVKDLLQNNGTPPARDGSPRKHVDTSSPALKLRTADAKDEDGIPAAPEKTEKKSRKKKSATASAANSTPASQTDRDVAANGGNGSRASSTAKTPDPSKSAAPAVLPPASTVGSDAIDGRINTMEARICERVSSSVHVAFDDLKTLMDQQFRARDSEFEQKQRTLLGMVSNVLNSNTERVLGKLVQQQFEAVMPMLREDVARSVTETLGSKINGQVTSVLQREMKSLPSYVSNSLRSQEVSKAISDKVVQAIGRQIDEQVGEAVSSHVMPAFSSVSAQTSQTLAQGLLQKIDTRFSELEQYQMADSGKLDSMRGLLTHLSETVSTMAVAQTQYQNQVLKMQGQLQAQAQVLAQIQSQQTASSSPYAPQRQLSQQSQSQPSSQPQPQPQPPQHRNYDGSVGSYNSPSSRVVSQLPPGTSPSQHSNSSQRQQQQQLQHLQQLQQLQQQQLQQQQQQQQQPPPPPPPPQQQQQQQAPPPHILYAPKSHEERERAETEQLASAVDELLRNGKYDEAMVRWLQSSGKEEELFRRVVVNYRPDIISHLQPLVLLSVGTTLTQSLDGPLLPQKLAWVEMVILNLYQVVHQLDDQTREITPNVMVHIRARLDQVRMQISEMSTSDPNVKNITQMISIINRIVDIVSSPNDF